MKEDPFPIILNIFSQILEVFNFDTIGIYSFFIIFFLIVILLIFSAFISGAEVSYFSLTMSDLEVLQDHKKKNKLILKLLKFPKSLLASILIANNFINVAIVILSAYLTKESINLPEDSFLEFIFQVIVITSLLVLFGEITPKVYANQNAVKVFA